MNNLTYFWCFDLSTIETSSNPTEEISRKNVNYKLIKEKKRYLPIRLFLDISLEFTLIPYELGSFLNLKRLPGNFKN